MSLSTAFLTGKGGSVEQLLDTNYVQPYVQILYNVTDSTAGATALTCLLFVLLVVGTINQSSHYSLPTTLRLCPRRRISV